MNTGVLRTNVDWGEKYAHRKGFYEFVFHALIRDRRVPTSEKKERETRLNTILYEKVSF